MKPSAAHWLALLLSTVFAVRAEPTDFEKIKPAALPANWFGPMTASGSPRWRVQFDRMTATMKDVEWHTRRVKFTGPKFVVFLDGKNVLTATNRTFTKSGMVRVWTKSDGVTAFDDFSYGSL